MHGAHLRNLTAGASLMRAVSGRAQIMTAKRKKAIAFLASSAPMAISAREALSERYGDVPLHDADVIVALGGDGFMLETLNASQWLDTPAYGMNRGTVGFLINAYCEDRLDELLDVA